MMHYKTHGTCSTAIDLEIEGGKITSCRFTNGCRGNTDGLARLAVGQDGARGDEPPCAAFNARGGTSCPDQLSRAIEIYLDQQQHK